MRRCVRSRNLKIEEVMALFASQHQKKKISLSSSSLSSSSLSSSSYSQSSWSDVTKVTQQWINTALKTHQLEHEHVSRSFCSNVHVSVDWIVRRGVRRNYRQNQTSSFLPCNCLHTRLTLTSLPWMLLIQIQSRRNEAVMSVSYEDQQAKLDLLMLYNKMTELNGSKSKEKIQDRRKLLSRACFFSFIFRKYGVQISKH
jgi:hypothetical protein